MVRYRWHPLRGETVVVRGEKRRAGCAILVCARDSDIRLRGFELPAWMLGEEVDLDIKPLAVEIKDSSFRMFRSDNAEEIRVAHGVPGRLIGLTEKGGLGGAGEGTSQQEIFKYHVIEPKQTRLEYEYFAYGSNLDYYEGVPVYYHRIPGHRAANRRRSRASTSRGVIL